MILSVPSYCLSQVETFPRYSVDSISFVYCLFFNLRTTSALRNMRSHHFALGRVLSLRLCMKSSCCPGTHLVCFIQLAFMSRVLSRFVSYSCDSFSSIILSTSG